MASSLSGDGRTRHWLPRPLGNPCRRRHLLLRDRETERDGSMGLGARVAGCCLLGPYGGGGGCCWAGKNLGLSRGRSCWAAAKMCPAIVAIYGYLRLLADLVS